MMNTITAAERIYNPVQKDWVTFVETVASTGGQRTVVDVELAPGGGTPLHYHRSYAERFTVLSGTLGIQLGDRTQLLQPGESATAPIGVRHRFFNGTDRMTHFRTELDPGSRGFEDALRIGYGVARDGLITASGMPRSPYHLALLIELSDTRMPGIVGVLQPVLRLLARRARRVGVEQQLRARYCARPQ